MKRNKLIYTAGKYTADNRRAVAKNIKFARHYAMKIWELGYIAICPHLNNSHFEMDCACDYEAYMDGDLEIISRCDGIFMIPGWKLSSGAKREKKHAENLNIPVFLDLNTLAKNL